MRPSSVSTALRTCVIANQPVMLHGSPGGGKSQIVKQLADDTAIQAADTLMLTVPNQLGVEYNAHAIESILKYVAPELGWR